MSNNSEEKVSQNETGSHQLVVGALLLAGGCLLYFFSGPSTVNVAKMNAKLMGQNASAVKKELGAPDGENGYWYYYYRCISELTEKPVNLRVHFSRDDKVEKVTCAKD